MKQVSTILGQTYQIVCETLLIERVDPQTDLFEAGIMDSLALVNLIMNLEDAFNILIPAEELNIEDYRSVESISEMVERLQLVKS